MSTLWWQQLEPVVIAQEALRDGRRRPLFASPAGLRWGLRTDDDNLLVPWPTIRSVHTDVGQKPTASPMSSGQAAAGAALVATGAVYLAPEIVRKMRERVTVLTVVTEAGEIRFEVSELDDQPGVNLAPLAPILAN